MTDLWCDNCGDETDRRYLCPDMCRRLVCLRCHDRMQRAVKAQAETARQAAAAVKGRMG